MAETNYVYPFRRAGCPRSALDLSEISSSRSRAGTRTLIFISPRAGAWSLFPFAGWTIRPMGNKLGPRVSTTAGSRNSTLDSSGHGSLSRIIHGWRSAGSRATDDPVKSGTAQAKPRRATGQLRDRLIQSDQTVLWPV